MGGMVNLRFTHARNIAPTHTYAYNTIRRLKTKFYI